MSILLKGGYKRLEVEHTSCSYNDIMLDHMHPSTHYFFSIQGEDVRLMLWDTAGQEEFDCITRAYYR